ncbi:hypothetical protein GALMADRAFT_228107 [Galerina marginata CBS 339.88]|uniref:C3H1-type domain-containing protein n=1 Tax=Galerina marginata (strain CBS 339.88) TaxID=685588 RepID=A0A067SRZ6_GALM3|nr:hypothetical protein GALMADRAFT_228107 [Galerina marginata CBS 339.88]
MALPDPSWRVKTRPCPFYQQGKCLFADSCNFLHNAPAPVIPEPMASDNSQVAAGPSTPSKLPQVIVNSPQSIRSPPRSPRTASLLLALRDVIGDPDEEEGNHEGTKPADAWFDSLPTLVNETGFGEFSQSNDPVGGRTLVEGGNGHEEEDDDDFEGNWTAISDYSDDTTSRVLQENVGQVNEPNSCNVHPKGDDAASEDDTFQVRPAMQNDDGGSRILERESPASASGLLSPIELSTLNFGPLFRIDTSTRDTNSFDSGYADTWKPPAPLLASPPRSPSISSTFDLLSSPFGSHSGRVLSPRLSAFLAHSPTSPAHTVFPSAQEVVEPFDLGLDSPSNYRNDRADNIVSAGADNIDQDTLLSHLSTDHQDGSEDEEMEHESFGHTSIWDIEVGSTAVFIGNPPRPLSAQVDDALKRMDTTPTHFLTSSELQFQDDEIIENSSNAFPTEESLSGDDTTSTSNPLSGQSEQSRDSDEDTAFLAYLNSPQVATNENDTLNSLYDVYSGITPEENNIPSTLATEGVSPPTQEPTILSNSSTPASSLRERVFTPPPVTRKRSGTITADSPNSVASPMTSLDSVSRGRASPFSVVDDKSPLRRTGSQSSFGQEVEVSRKVPFGFRSAFGLGRSSRSSLMTNRNGRRSVPVSPLQVHTEMLGSSSRPSPEDQPPSEQVPKGLKPLRLSTTFDAKHISRSVFQSRMSSSSVHSFRQSGNTNRTSISSSSVSSNHSISDNPLLSSARSSLLPLHIRNSLLTSDLRTRSPSPLSPFLKNHANLDDPPQSAPATSWRQSVNYSRPSSRLSEPFYERDEDDEDDTTGRFSRNDPFGEIIRRPIPQAPNTAPVTHAPSSLHQPMYAIETPKPTLMFAIASDNVDQVREVLESGDANPNETVGPQSALEFVLTNDKLSNKLDIVKTLLAYGADPAVAKNIPAPDAPRQEQGEQQTGLEDNCQMKTLLDELDPATRYYLDRANAVHTRRISVLIQRSFFRPLTRVRYDLIGQDRALEQLFRVLSMHSRNLAVTPVVVMLCGPSGHGKSLLARKFGSLLDVPTHTVNMTTLRSTHDLWQSYSMNPYEAPTTCTLAEFLINNEGKRCVVVLDEIEKTVDQNALWSLLMPWELGKCSFEAGSRHVDVKNVIWLGTSNIGHDLVFQHRESRKNPEEPMSREEYVELMALLRPKVSERLGASVLSRITTVLPFVPFSTEEKKAICSEALYTLGGDLARTWSSDSTEALIETALTSYCASEGARSLSRAISNQLVDMI